VTATNGLADLLKRTGQRNGSLSWWTKCPEHLTSLVQENNSTFCSLHRVCIFSLPACYVQCACRTKIISKSSWRVNIIGPALKDSVPLCFLAFAMVMDINTNLRKVCTMWSKSIRTKKFRLIKVEICYLTVPALIPKWAAHSCRLLKSRKTWKYVQAPTILSIAKLRRFIIKTKWIELCSKTHDFIHCKTQTIHYKN